MQISLKRALDLNGIIAIGLFRSFSSNARHFQIKYGFVARIFFCHGFSCTTKLILMDNKLYSFGSATVHGRNEKCPSKWVKMNSNERNKKKKRKKNQNV